MSYPLRQRWCLALQAPLIVFEGRDPLELAGWGGLALSRGADEVYLGSLAYLKGWGITTRDELIAWAKPRIRGGAWDLANLVAALGYAERGGVMSTDDVWNVILLAGKLAQQGHASWDDFAAGYERGRLAAGGVAEITPAVRDVWRELPWATELDVTIVDGPGAKPRFLRATCSTCGAPRTRPSPTAYVYCDACGGLVDYDFAMVREVQQPGPAYERLHAQLAPELAAARERADQDAYRAVQRRLYDAWLEACPNAAPVRIKDPAYRAAFVAAGAEARVVADFDDEARAREAAMHAAIGQLQFLSVAGKIRVPTERFHALAAAYFDYEACCDQLFALRGVYALHPDGASRELQRRIGYSAFVQGWLAMLDEADAAALIARTGLAREYVSADPPATRPATCSQCNAPLVIVDGARRIVCEHCGRLVDVVG